ncbi:MAG: SDR family oxidoreductase [Clostridia bacterium]|nr:SDR family oxidoreductase [Clostridia bacterium]
MINPMDLTGKRILVTGAAGGMGRVTSVQLSKLGAKVVLCDMVEDPLKDVFSQLEGDGHAMYCFDLNDVDGIEALVKQIVKECGVFHGFAHCAGIAPMRPLKMTKKDDIINVMNANLFSFIEIVRCITKKGCFEDEGSIVAISSTASIQGKQAKVAYSASKAGLDGAIRCLVCDLKKQKIRVNSIMPCWVNTRMYSGYIDRYPDTFEVQEIREKQYMGVTEPIEIANTVAFLLSDAAKTITGTSILIDGGMSQG